LPLDQDEGRGYLVFWGVWENGDDACVAFDTRPKSASIKKKSIQNIWNSKRLKEEEPNAALKKCVLPRAVKLIYKRNIRTGFRARGVQRIGSGSSSSPGVENWTWRAHNCSASSINSFSASSLRSAWAVGCWNNICDHNGFCQFEYYCTRTHRVHGGYIGLHTGSQNFSFKVGKQFS